MPLINPGLLLEWAAEHRRDLPWRRTRDPWLVLVSELMLQQTQVTRVVPKFEAFIERFATPAECAAAAPAEVIELWAGLGYNRRALNLHRCAQRVVTEHAGALPEDLEALLALPGVGPYTARAVLAFAFERDVGVLDTNVGRILARREGRRLSGRAAQDLADACVPVGHGWEWNQAILDLGATICTKRAPKCSSCPVFDGCAHQGVGDDPAVGSAAVPKPQSRFEGSDRQGRGRLVKALVAGPVPIDGVAAAFGWEDPERTTLVLGTLIADGLVVERDGMLFLP